MARTTVSLLVAALGAGCAGTATPASPVAPRQAEPSPEDVDAAMQHPRPTSAAPASRTLQEPSAPLTGTVRIQESAPAPRKRSGRKVDVELHRASLTEALQFLAGEARINLVLGDGISGEVSLSLRRVDPAEALEALAESRGLTLSQQGSILVVQKR
jgi:hypothetical protein